MTNAEIADKFRNRVKGFNKDVAWDYFDRSVDLAIYFNETSANGAQKDLAIQSLEDTMVSIYIARDDVIEVKEEVSEGQ